MIGGPLWSDSFESDQSQPVPLFFGGDRTVDYLFHTDTHLSEVCSLLHRVLLQESVCLMVPVSLVLLQFSPTPLSRPIHLGCGNLGSSFMAGLICYGEADVCINIWKSDGWSFWTCMDLSAVPLIWLDQINSLLLARGGAVVFSLLSHVAVVWFYFVVSHVAVVWFYFVVCLFEAFDTSQEVLWTSVYIFKFE